MVGARPFNPPSRAPSVQHAGAARGGHALHEELRIIRPLERLQLRLRLARWRRSARRRADWPRHSSGGSGRSGGSWSSSLPGSRLQLRRVQAHELRHVGAGHVDGLLRPARPGVSRRRQLRLHSRFVGARPQFARPPAHECCAEAPASYPRRRARPAAVCCAAITVRNASAVATDTS